MKRVEQWNTQRYNFSWEKTVSSLGKLARDWVAITYIKNSEDIYLTCGRWFNKRKQIMCQKNWIKHLCYLKTYSRFKLKGNSVYTVDDGWVASTSSLKEKLVSKAKKKPRVITNKSVLLLLMPVDF